MKINEQKENIIKISSTKKLFNFKIDMKDCHEGGENYNYEKSVNRKPVI